jgi:curved DNA-binding protein CbpA
MHIHDAARILELGAPPYETGRIRAARRRLAKQWHPDKAPPAQRVVHENHMVAVNRAADLLFERAEEAGGSIGASHVAAARQAARAEQRAAGERAARAEDPAPRGGRRRTRAPERSVVHSYARSESHPEWGVGRVVGVFVTGDGEDVRRWAEVSFAGQPTRTLRYENLRFVDFSRPDPGSDRARRFLAAARRAAGQGDHQLAVRRLLHARAADPRNATVLRLLALEQRASGDPAAAIRTCADWGRVAPRDPQPHRLTQTLYAETGAPELADEAGRRAKEREGRDELAPRRRGRRRRRRARAA